MQVVTASGTITSGTEKIISFPNLQGGHQVVYLLLSVENTTTVEIEGIDNLMTMSINDTTGYFEDGITFGGDLEIDLSKLYQFVPEGKTILEIRGIPKITFNQSTGSDVDYAVVMIVQET